MAVKIASDLDIFSKLCNDASYVTYDELAAPNGADARLIGTTSNLKLFFSHD